MDERDRDEPGLEDLRAAWSRLGPPSSPPDGDDPGDAVTRAAVAWVATAYRDLPAPPGPAARTGRRRPIMAPRLRRAAAAAVLVALIGGGAWLLSRPGGAPESGNPARDGGASDVASQTVAVLSATADRIEMQSGPVRLVLLTPFEPLAAADTHSPTGDLR